MVEGTGKEWIVTITYASETGEITVDYAVDDLRDIWTLTKQGPGHPHILSYFVARQDPKSARTIEEFYSNSGNHQEPEAC